MLDLPRIRCAVFHEAQHADPIGSAPAYDGFLVIDVSLPWEAEVTGQEPIRSIVDGPGSVARSADGSRWRALARVPDATDLAEGRRRITEHRAVRCAHDGLELRGPFRRREWVVDASEVVALGRALLGSDGGVEPLPVPLGRSSDVDLLMCAHGRRDGCCGSFGTALHDHLGPVFADSGALVDRQRISHTGGHRFAPTALTFPDGYAWAHLDEELTDRLVRRVDEPARFAMHCRGSTMFDAGPAQAADRAGLVEVGWAWADGARSVAVTGFDRSTMATTLRCTCLLPDGAVRSLDVVVVPDRQVPMPTCGVVDGPEYRTETVWRVDEVTTVQ